MKLWSMRGTCAVAVHIALEWSPLDYEVEILKRGAQRSVEYLSVNPMGVVPAVTCDDGAVLTEATALLALIDAHSPGEFAPGQARLSEFRLQELLSFLNSEIHAAFGPHFAAARYHPDPDIQAELRQTAYQKIDRLMSLLDSRIKGPFYFGAQRSVADPYIFVIARWLKDTPLKKRRFDNLERLADAMNDDEKVRSVLTSYRETAPMR